MQYIDLFSHLIVQLPGNDNNNIASTIVTIIWILLLAYRTMEMEYSHRLTVVTGDLTTITTSTVRNAKLEVKLLPSVELSQKQELAVCRPAPFFCIMTLVTV